MKSELIIESTTYEQLDANKLNAQYDWVTAGAGALIVKNTLSKTEIKQILSVYRRLSLTSRAEWQKPTEKSTDYYRQIDQHPESKVPQVVGRALLFGSNTNFLLLRESFLKILKMKNEHDLCSLHAPPSDPEYFQAAISCYPIGGGMLGIHKDPATSYGAVHCLVNLSTRGLDYVAGGLFLSKELEGFGSTQVDVEQHWSAGDALLFNAEAIDHGVNLVDQYKEKPQLFLRGRFTLSLTKNVNNLR